MIVTVVKKFAWLPLHPVQKTAPMFLCSLYWIIYKFYIFIFSMKKYAWSLQCWDGAAEKKGGFIDVYILILENTEVIILQQP